MLPVRPLLSSPIGFAGLTLPETTIRYIDLQQAIKAYPTERMFQKIYVTIAMQRDHTCFHLVKKHWVHVLDNAAALKGYIPSPFEPTGVREYVPFDQQAIDLLQQRDEHIWVVIGRYYRGTPFVECT